MGSFRAIQQYVSVAAVALWLGGFTFYASFVIPAGEQTVGTLNQGYITQRVADRLNGVACVALVLIGLDIALHRRHLPRLLLWSRLVAAAAFATGLVVLFVLNPQLDALLDPTKRSPPDRLQFKPLHNAYEFAVTVMWAAGVFELGAMLAGHRRRAADLASSHEKPPARISDRRSPHP